MSVEDECSGAISRRRIIQLREFSRSPTDIRLCTYLHEQCCRLSGVEQLGYRRVSRQALQDVADEIREQHDLEELELCADTLKHLRKTGGSRTKFAVTATSSDVSLDQATWKIYNSRFMDVLESLCKA